MDRKDLELLIRLFEFGRIDPSALAPLLSITEVNVHRRIVLLQKEGIIEGFSAFFDRRSFGYDTTFLKAHFPTRKKTQVMAEMGRVRNLASIYPNMDDFAIVETVHKDLSALRTQVQRLEEVCTISAAYTPRLPDMVPDIDPITDVPLLRLLVKNGYATCSDLSRSLKEDPEDVSERIRRVIDGGGVRIVPLLAEDQIYPYPCFSYILVFENEDALPAAMGTLKRIAPMLFQCMPLAKPPGLWIKAFGQDLHAMDHMLERLRRLDAVTDMTVILPDSPRYWRETDLRILERTVG